MSIILNPIEQFFDIDGSPLDQGYIYLGAVNGNPETSPIQVYWDSSFTIPAVQPIRTINGYPARNGTPASIYSISDVSLQVRNKKKASVFYTPTSSISNASSNISIRSSNTLMNQGDNGKVIIASGTFTQTFDASVALGNGWTVTYVNIGTGIITLDPNLSELIDGVASEQIFPNKSCIISCDGVGLISTLVPVDTNPVVSGSVDRTKKLKFEIDGFTTGTTRTVTWPDKDLTPADAADVSNKLLGIVIYTASGTAAASDVGKLTYLNAATAQTLTLPAIASCPIGTILSYVNIIGLGTWTIQRGGSALIFGMGSNNVTSIQLTPQSSIQFTNDGTNWIQIVGSNLNLLGANGTSYTNAVNYLAATDGFVFGRCFSSGTPMSLTVFSDSSATPTTTLLECGTNTGTNNYWIPFCAPIKKGNYWRIVMGAGSAPTINFTPMGV